MTDETLSIPESDLTPRRSAPPTPQRQRGFERMTTPVAGAVGGVIATGSGVALPSLTHPGSGVEFLILGATLVGLVGAMLALQFQAAILILRDGRCAPAATSCVICVASLTLIVLPLVHEPEPIALVAVAIAVTLLYPVQLVRYRQPRA